MRAANRRARSAARADDGRRARTRGGEGARRGDRIGCRLERSGLQREPAARQVRATPASSTACATGRNKQANTARSYGKLRAVFRCGDIGGPPDLTQSAFARKRSTELLRSMRKRCSTKSSWREIPRLKSFEKIENAHPTGDPISKQYRLQSKLSLFRQQFRSRSKLLRSRAPLSTTVETTAPRAATARPATHFAMNMQRRDTTTRLNQSRLRLFATNSRVKRNDIRSENLIDWLWKIGRNPRIREGERSIMIAFFSCRDRCAGSRCGRDDLGAALETRRTRRHRRTRTARQPSAWESPASHCSQWSSCHGARST